MKLPRPAGGDQTADLQAAIDAVSDGVLAFPRNADYVVDGSLRFIGRKLDIRGHGAELHRSEIVGDTDPTAKTAWSPQLLFRDCDQTLVNKLRVSSVGTGHYDHAVEGECAVQVQACRDCQFALDIDSPAGDGYTLGWYQQPGSGAAGVPSERVYITGGSVSKPGRQGVGVTSNVIDCGCSGVAFSDCARSVLDLEMSGDNAVLDIDGFTFQKNRATGVNLGFVAAGGYGIHRNVKILDNIASTLKSKLGRPLETIDRFGFVISGNVGTEPHTGDGPLLAFRGFDGLEVTNNQQEGGSTAYAFCENYTESGNSWNA